MRKGDEVKKFLVERLKEHQPGKSSFWDKFLEQFSYTESDGLKGIRGFGTISRRGIKEELYHKMSREIVLDGGMGVA